MRPLVAAADHTRPKGGTTVCRLAIRGRQRSGVQVERDALDAIKADARFADAMQEVKQTESRSPLQLFDMHQIRAIVYVSAAVDSMSDPILEALLIEARRLNKESGITGALIHSDGVFMQYFEGECDPMEQTYARIRRSSLHSRIVELMNEPIAAREFPEWQMALAQPSRSVILALATSDWVVQGARTSARATDSVGFSLLRDFWGRRQSLP